MEKLKELQVFIDEEEIQSLLPLIGIINQKIEDNTEKNKIFTELTHYLLGVLSTTQEYYIIWEIKENEQYIEMPVLTFQDGRIDRLTTHEQTKSIDTLLFLVRVFEESVKQKYEQKEKKVKRKE